MKSLLSQRAIIAFGLALMVLVVLAVGRARTPSGNIEDHITMAGPDSQTWVVCPQGPPTCRFSKIQAAIDTAPEGATIAIKAGTYEENLLIRKSLTLQAVEEQVVIKSATESLPTLLLVSGRPIQVGVIGLTILAARKHQGNGIEVMGLVAARIERNTIQDYKWGILVLGKAGGLSPSEISLIISGNTIRGNSSSVVIWQSSNVVITKNLIQDNKAPVEVEGVGGIFIGNSQTVVVSENLVQSNSFYGVGVLQSRGIQMTANLIKSNSFAGIYVEGSQVELLSNQLEQNGLFGVAIAVKGPGNNIVSLSDNRIGAVKITRGTSCW